MTISAWPGSSQEVRKTINSVERILRLRRIGRRNLPDIYPVSEVQSIQRPPEPSQHWSHVRDIVVEYVGKGLRV